MTTLFQTTVLAIISFQFAQGRSFWSGHLPRVSDIQLEKGKPIRLKTSYTTLQLSNLNGTIYTNTLSQLYGVTNLRISQSDVQKIEPGGLCSSADLKILELDFSTVEAPELTKQTFENCNNIEELILRFDLKSTKNISNDALENLPNLKKLQLDGYNLEKMRKEFLKLPKSLTNLEFSSCNIHEVDVDVFEDLKNLEQVSMTHNREFKALPKTLFEENPKLKVLILRVNNFENLTWDEFEGLSNVEELTLSQNKINYFDAEKVATYLPNLKVFDVKLNALLCKRIEAFAKALKKKLPSVDVIYKFDPDCYDSCEEES